MWDTEFYVNIDAVVAGAERIGSTMSRLNNIVESELRYITKDILRQEFNWAVRQANAEGGFPESFQQHLLGVVSDIIPTVIADGNDVFINLNLEEYLGTRDDLVKAFHQGATLADGGQLWGPYTGQELRNENAEDRHIFWEAIQRGDTRAPNPSGGGEIHIPGGAWERTQEQYIAIWGEKAPEWLFIQFGQEEWAPYVPATDIIGNVREAVQNAAAVALFNIVENEVAIANTYKTTGLQVGYSQSGTPRVREGTYTDPRTGKTYRPGRFVPKGGIT